jgi:hypothetical protein
MSTIEFSTTDGRVQTELRPYVLHDVREGPANNHGQTREENTYKLVKVGTQIWTAENLRTTRYGDNGENIPTGQEHINDTIWENGMFPAVQFEMRLHSAPSQQVTTSNRDANDPSPRWVDLRQKYGLAYNYHALVRARGLDGTAIADHTDKLSPKGTPWRVARQSEYIVLSRYAHQYSGAWIDLPPPEGVQGKLSGYSLENYPAGGTFVNDTGRVYQVPTGHATNVTGFSAIGNVSRSNTLIGRNSNTMFLCLDSYQYRAGRPINEQHWMHLFEITTNQTAEAGHRPNTPSNVSCHRAKYVRLILDL